MGTCPFVQLSKFAQDTIHVKTEPRKQIKLVPQLQLHIHLKSLT